MMTWIPLNSVAQIAEIKEKSKTRPQVIYKHSTRCSISTVVKARLDRGNASDYSNFDFYFLDLITYRQVSNAVAETFRVQHESPQILLIRNETCIYNDSHMAIDLRELQAQDMLS